MKGNNTLILVLLSIGLFYTFINPQFHEVQRLQGLSNDYSHVLASVSTISETRNRLLAEYQSMPEADLDRLNKSLPDHIDNVRLALDLDSMAGRHGIAIKNIQTDTDNASDATVVDLNAPEKPYQKAKVSFTFVASHDGFRDFLADIERSLRIMDIELTSFQVGSTDLYEYHMTVNTYWLQ